MHARPLTHITNGVRVYQGYLKVRLGSFQEEKKRRKAGQLKNIRKVQDKTRQGSTKRQDDRPPKTRQKDTHDSTPRTRHDSYQDSKRKGKVRRNSRLQPRTRQDNTHDTKQDNARQEKTRQKKKTRQDKTRQDKTRQDKTRQDKKKQDKTRQD